jgi:hypothetical protein
MLQICRALFRGSAIQKLAASTRRQPGTGLVRFGLTCRKLRRKVAVA